MRRGPRVRDPDDSSIRTAALTVERIVYVLFTVVFALGIVAAAVIVLWFVGTIAYDGITHGEFNCSQGSSRETAVCRFLDKGGTPSD